MAKRRTFAPRLRQALARMLPSEAESKGLSGRVATQFRQYIVPGQPYQRDWNVDRAVREGYEVNPWIYRAVDVIASTAVARTVVLREGDPNEGDPVDIGADPTHLLHVLNVQSNPWERAKIFRYRLIAQLLLSSRGVFVEVVRSHSGGIAMLNLIDPDQVEVIPTRQELPGGREKIDPLGAFRITVHDQSGPYNDLPRFDPAATARSQPNSILWVRLPHPVIMTTGMSPMQAAGLSADLDRAARLYNRRFLNSDGRPGGILAVKGVATRDTLESLEARFNGGPESAGRTTAIQADAMEYVDTSGNPRDTQWSDTMDRMRKEISIAFGVPESVLGDASGRTYDNADAEYAMYLENRFKPLIDTVDDQLDILTGSYDDSLYLRHDLSDLWVLDRHRRVDLATAAEEVRAGLRTIEEYRDLAKLPRIDSPLARVLLVNGGRVIAAPDEGTMSGAAQALTAGMATPADPAEEARRGAEQGVAQGSRMAENINGARPLRLVEQEARRGFDQDLERRSLPMEGMEGKQSRARHWS